MKKICNGKFSLKTEFPELDVLFKDIDENKVKVIGSYLYKEDFHDIDICTSNIETGYKIKMNARKNKMRVQIVFVNEDKFNNIENLLTFCNTSFALHNRNYKFSDHFDESDMLKMNDKSIEVFKNSSIVFREIEKMKNRGFKF